ncbi:MAG: hypothetical protein WCV81_03745 [Microgenomates group bacterium]|jgi:DNA polymerase III delta prime subunit
MIPKLIIHPQISEREQHIQNLVSDLGFNQNHPDLLWFGPEEKMGMDQAKKIKNFLKLKPYQASGQMIVIVASEKLTSDAQNALLKTLEEHADGVNLILGAGQEDQLLETLISRCQIINLNQNTNRESPEALNKLSKQIETLATSSTEERFKFIEKLEDKDLFLLALTHYFRDKLPREESVYFLKDLLTAQKWANQNVNIRAILEYLMLKMPKKNLRQKC